MAVSIGGTSGGTSWFVRRSALKLVVCVAAVLGTASGALAQSSQISGSNGIGGFDLKSSSDMAFPFDYNSTGNLDHIVLYRPGSGIIYIEAKQNGAYSPVFTSFSGIGGYDLGSTSDRVMAFDYDGSGHADHLLCYRPGTGIVFILANNNGQFSPVYTSFAGIGGFDLGSSADRIISFDYDGSGRYDHLVLYRPGTGLVFIVQHTNGMFTDEVESSTGLGGYDMSSPNDRLIAFDYYSIGTADHLVAYRPGAGTAFILENTNGSGNFAAVQGFSTGIGGYDLGSTSDRLVAYDYSGIGSQDHLLAYRPGTGTMFVLQSAYFAYTPVFSTTSGIGGYDLKSPADRIFSFDYNDTGIMNTLALYRPGSSDFFIEMNTSGTFAPLVRHSTDYGL